MPIYNHIAEGKFKKVLISYDDLKKESKYLYPYLKEIQVLEKEHRLMDWEVVFLFLLLYLKLRSKKYVINENLNFLKLSISPQKIQKSIKINELPTSLKDLLSGNDTCSTLFEYLISKRFLKIPGEIKECILHWAMGDYSIFLTNSVPTPMDVLYTQAEGNRMVTLSYPHSIEGNLMLGNRDAFEFVLHDLSHAHTFFNSYYNPLGQIQFFKNLTQKWNYLRPYLKDLEFQKKIEYLQSDMNSHPEHLKSYLKAILVESKRRIREQKK